MNKSRTFVTMLNPEVEGCEKDNNSECCLDIIDINGEMWPAYLYFDENDVVTGINCAFKDGDTNNSLSKGKTSKAFSILLNGLGIDLTKITNVEESRFNVKPSSDPAKIEAYFPTVYIAK